MSRLGKRAIPGRVSCAKGPKASRRGQQGLGGEQRKPEPAPRGLHTSARRASCQGPLLLSPHNIYGLTRAHVHETELLTKCLHFYSSVEGKNLHSFFARAAVTKCYRPSSCNEMASQLWRLDLTLGWWQASPPGTGGLQAISDSPWLLLHRPWLHMVRACVPVSPFVRVPVTLD